MKIRTVSLRHEGGQRFAGKTGTDRSIVFGEAVATNEYSPVESIVASLAACTAMDVISIALKKRQGVERYVVLARAEQRDEYPKIFTRIDLVHEVVGSSIATRSRREPSNARSIHRS